MKNISGKHKKATAITEENKHLFPEDIQRAFDFFEKNKDKILMPEKFYASLFSLLKSDLREYFEINPKTPIGDVVAYHISGLNKKIPGDKILEIAELIVTTWEKLKQEKEELVAI